MNNQLDDVIDFRQFLYKVANNWYLFLLGVFLSLSVAYAVNRYSHALYKSETTVLINQEDYISASLMGPAPSMSSSISLAKEASKMRMREKTRKILEREKNRLGHFTRFCDLVITSQLVENVIKVSETVFNEINAVQSQEDNNDGVFVVEALFPATAGVTTTLTPELDVLLENIETSSRSHSLQVVNAMPRILSAAATSLPADAHVPFLAQTISASKIAKESERALEAWEKTLSKLHEDFYKAVEYCKRTEFVNAPQYTILAKRIRLENT